MYKVVTVHKKERGRCYEAHNHRAQTGEYAFDDGTVAVAADIVSGIADKHEGRQYYHERRQQATMIFLRLIWSYLKIGFFGFGGGYAMLALIQNEIVTPGWITEQMFTDIVAISQMTPGPIGINSATYIGYVAPGASCCFPADAGRAGSGEHRRYYQCHDHRPYALEDGGECGVACNQLRREEHSYEQNYEKAWHDGAK